MIESSDYSDNTLKEEIAVLFVAGTDTSAVAISFTSMLLARHPSVQEKVYQEWVKVELTVPNWPLDCHPGKMFV